jgi:hypothetical protein
MEEPSPYTIYVLQDPDRFNRYRWAVYENGKKRDGSFNNFETMLEARADAEAFVDKLIFTWQRTPDPKTSRPAE